MDLNLNGAIALNKTLKLNDDSNGSCRDVSGSDSSGSESENQELLECDKKLEAAKPIPTYLTLNWSEDTNTYS